MIADWRPVRRGGLVIAYFRGVNFLFIPISTQISNISIALKQMIKLVRLASGNLSVMVDWRSFYFFSKQNLVLNNKIKKICNLQSAIVNLQSKKLALRNNFYFQFDGTKSFNLLLFTFTISH